MENHAAISWKGNQIGKVSNITSDMWYIEADWLSSDSEHSSKFEDIASKLNAKKVMQLPSRGLIAELYLDNLSSISRKVLVLSLDSSKIFMRWISDETAALVDFSILPPWQPINNADLYKNELKKEASFFHPLKWKKVSVIGKRADRDDVLFEVLHGKYKYAIVHLTYTRKRSRKFPITKFYVDWSDVYKNQLLEDHKEWKKDQDRDTPVITIPGLQQQWKFEVIHIGDHHNRGQFIFARQLNFRETIKINEAALLNGIPVYHYEEMYPISDDQGQPQLDIYVFRPILDRFPKDLFQEGQIVELLNPE